MKLALVYDRVNKIGGAERVLETLLEIWPEAPLYTAVYNPKTADWAGKFKVIPSFLNKLSFARSRHEAYPYLMPLAFESFNLDEYDVVISITSEAAKGIITKPKTLHICYCLTPTRYLWSGYQDYFQNKAFRFLTKPVVAYLRTWDKIAAQRPDAYLAISENVKRRIKKYYGRDSEVIYPPLVFPGRAEVAHRNFDSASDSLAKKRLPLNETPRRSQGEASQNLVGSPRTSRSYFLVVSRLDFGYKKVDLVIEAFNQLGLPLKIIGTGSQMRNLKRKSQNNIEFLGQLTDKELLGYYQKCRAVIFPQEEDFGLVPLEAQACGKPVIAYRGGGALETVIEARSASSGQGPTGEFFDEQTPESLTEVVKKFKPEKYNPEDCRQNALKFDIKIFKKKWKTYLKNIYTF